jgi:hypothetical protein
MSHTHLKIKCAYPFTSSHLLILLICIFSLIHGTHVEAAQEERRLAILSLDASSAREMAYLAPSIEAMLKSRLTKPGLLKVMAAPDTKAKLGYRARIRNHGHSCFLCEIVIRSQFHTTYEPEA